MRGSLVLILVSAHITVPLFADTIIMKSGEKYMGEIVEEADEYIRLKSDSKILKIKRSAIAEISIPQVERVEPEELENARAFGEAAAKREVAPTTWVAAGLLLGPIGILMAYATTPSPPESYLVGKSPEYVEVFTNAYTQKGKSIQRNRALQGCVGGSVVAGCLYLMIITMKNALKDW